MSKTVEELRSDYNRGFWSVPEADGLQAQQNAGIAAVIRALAPDDDEIAAYNRLSYKVQEQLKCECEYLPEDRCIRCSVVDALKCLETRYYEILGDAGSDPAPVHPDEPLVVSPTGLGLSPAPAPAPCLWRVHHETRNGPLYVSQCDGEWRHATADPKCPSCKKDIFFVTDAAPAVCEWTKRGGNEPGFYNTPHGLCHINHLPKSGGCWCGKPIKFTEAKT